MVHCLKGVAWQCWSVCIRCSKFSSGRGKRFLRSAKSETGQHICHHSSTDSTFKEARFIWHCRTQNNSSQSIGQSVSQLVSQAVNQSVNQSISQSCQSVSQPVCKSISLTVKQ